MNRLFTRYINPENKDELADAVRLIQDSKLDNGNADDIVKIIKVGRQRFDTLAEAKELNEKTLNILSKTEGLYALGKGLISGVSLKNLEKKGYDLSLILPIMSIEGIEKLKSGADLEKLVREQVSGGQDLDSGTPGAGGPSL